MNTPQDTQLDERRGATSASNGEADLLCPGRHLAQRGLPHPPRSDDAAWGDQIHEALKTRRPEALSIEQRSIYDQIVEMEVKAVKEFYGPDADLSKLRYFPEHRVWIQFKTQVPTSNGSTVEVTLEHSAKADRVWRLGQRLFIPEYKTLKGEVADSPRNIQLRDQAVLARGHYMADDVGVTVLQPMVSSSYELCLYTKEDLDRAKDELFNRVYASNIPGAPRVPGGVQCKFCLAKNTSRCPEHQRWAGALAIRMNDLLEVPVANWSPEQRSVFCERFDAAQKWLNDTWDAMLEGAKRDGNFVPGYGMKPGNERETIDDPQKVFERFVALGGNTEGFLKAINVVKTRLAEQVNVATGKIGKQLQQQMSELTQGCVSTKRNKSSLVKIEK